MSDTDKATPNERKRRSSWRSVMSRMRPARLERDDARDLIARQLRAVNTATDHAFVGLLFLEWAAALALALLVSPLAWRGVNVTVHNHVWAALLLGGLLVLPPAIMVRQRAGTAPTRHVVAIAQILMSALLIHLTGGRIETHFHIFGSLAFLAFYRDPSVLVTATVVVLADHSLRGIYFPQSVFGTSQAPLWRSFEHAFWVVFEDVFLLLGIWRTQQISQTVAAEKVRELGQYLLHEKIDSGGMGDVYLAEHRMLKRACAVKLVQRTHLRDETILSRFEREVRTTAKLTHRNTVSVYDYGRLADGTFYYVMEFLDGATLARVVDTVGPLPPARAVHLLRQVCGALAEAHSIGFIHRDIKPENILVCRVGGEDDVAKLVDFGLVQAMSANEESSRLTQAGALVGTPAFMSPEQVSGEALDGRTDTYSLALVGYFLLTGTIPWQGKTQLAMLAARMVGPPAPPSALRPGIPADLEAVILKAMSLAPGDRFASAHELQRALAGCACASEWSDDAAQACRQEYKRLTATATGADTAAIAISATLHQGTVPESPKRAAERQ